MADDPDPNNLIRDHCDHIPTPKWVSDSYDFNNSKTNCRLCGELICRCCSSKVHCPPKFEKKDKDISRVCHACLFLVLVKRRVGGDNSIPVKVRVDKYIWGGTDPATLAEKEKLLPRVFFIPDWANVHDSASCFKCAYITERRHHCRLCGLLFCGDCSQKMADVPQIFDKKNKAGAKRVCDYCRFCMARGWRFQYPGETRASTAANEYAIRSGTNQGPLGYANDSSSSSSSAAVTPASSFKPIVKSTPPPVTITTQAPVSSAVSRFGGGGGASSTPAPPKVPVASHRPIPAVPGAAAPSPAAPPRPPMPSTPSFRPLSQCSVANCSQGATVAGLCATHDRENSALPKNQPCSFEVVVRFRWEEEIESQGVSAPVWAQVQLVGHSDLHAIHNLLSNQFPTMDGAAVQYVVRGRATQKMHWRMFEARFCTPDIQLRKLSPFDHKQLKSTATPQQSSSSSSSVASHYTPAAAPAPPARPVSTQPPVSITTAPRSPAPAAAPAPALPPVAPVQTLTREQLLAQSKPSRAGPVTTNSSPYASRAASPNQSRAQSRAGSPVRSSRAPPPVQPPPISIHVDRVPASGGGGAGATGATGGVAKRWPTVQA